MRTLLSLFLFIVLSVPSLSHASATTSTPSLWSSFSSAFEHVVESIIDYFIPPPVSAPAPKAAAPSVTESAPEILPTQPVIIKNENVVKPVEATMPSRQAYVTEARLQQAIATLNSNLARPIYAPNATTTTNVVNNNYYYQSGSKAGSNDGLAKSVSKSIASSAQHITSNPVFSGVFSNDLSVTNTNGGFALGSGNVSGGIATTTSVLDHSLPFTVVNDHTISLEGDQTQLLRNYTEQDYGLYVDPQTNVSSSTRTVTYVEYDDGDGTYFGTDSPVNYFSCDFTITDPDGNTADIHSCDYNGTGAQDFYVPGVDLTDWLIQGNDYNFSNFDSSINENNGPLGYSFDDLPTTFDGTNTIIDFSNYVGDEFRTVESGNINFQAIDYNPYQSVDAIAIGKGNTASNNQALAVGLGNIVSGIGSGAFGTNNTVTGTNAFAIGSGITNGTDNTVMIGTSNSAKLTIDSSGNTNFPAMSTFNNATFNGTTQFNGSITGNGGTLTLSNTRILGGYDRGTITAGRFGMTANSNHFYDLISSQFGVAGYGMIGGFGYGSPVIYMYDNNSENSFSVGKTVFGANPATAFTSLFTVRQNGNVGVGTTNPGAKLDVQGAVNFGTAGNVNGDLTVANAISIVGGTGGNSNFNITNGITSGLSAFTMSNTGPGGNSWQFLVGGNGVNGGGGAGANEGNFVIKNMTDNANRFFIGKGTGNIGIGTTNPQGKLDVSGGSLQVTNGTGATYANRSDGIVFARTDTPTSYKNKITNSMTGGAPRDTTMNFELTTNAGNAFTNVMTLTGAGNVGIGTSTPAYKLTVVGDDGSGNVASFRTGTGATTCTLNSSTGLLNCSSDRRLKQDITSLESSSTLDKILELDPVSYHWKTDVASSSLKFGFIAQDVQNIFPELVSTDSSTGFLTLSLNGMIPYIVSAIQNIAHQLAAMAHLIKTDEVQTNTVDTQQLCVSDDSGNKTCITKSELDSLLQERSISGGSTQDESSSTDELPAPDEDSTTTSPVTESEPEDPTPPDAPAPSDTPVPETPEEGQ